jgi:transcription initiation factor IIE alpha subunit
MLKIAKKEELVFNQIKIFALEYENGIPENIIKMELGMYEHDLKDILEDLASKNLISYVNKKIKLADFEKDITTVDSKQELIKDDLDTKEKKSLELIEQLANEDKTVPKYVVEGNLLYGELKLSNFRMYHIILSLENKGKIKPIEKTDGEYYLLVE